VTELTRFAQNTTPLNMPLLQYFSFCGTYLSILRFREVSMSNHNPRPIAVRAIAVSEAVV